MSNILKPKKQSLSYESLGSIQQNFVDKPLMKRSFSMGFNNEQFQIKAIQRRVIYE